MATAAALPHPHLRAQGHWQAATRAGAGGVRLRPGCVTLDAGERGSPSGARLATESSRCLVLGRLLFCTLAGGRVESLTVRDWGAKPKDRHNRVGGTVGGPKTTYIIKLCTHMSIVIMQSALPLVYTYARLNAER